MDKKKIDSGVFLEVIDKLPHSKTRVPHTYHHDYLRMNSNAHSQMSRSEVAAAHSSNDIELYAVALIQLLDELGSKAFIHLSSDDVIACKKAKEITDSVISRYNKKRAAAEFKHLAPYLPYQIKAVDDLGIETIIDWQHQSYTNSATGLIHVLRPDSQFQPILKPLTKLSKDELALLGLILRDIEISKATHKDKIFGVEDGTAWIRGGMKPVMSLPQCQKAMEYLFSIHADVFHLVDKGIAKEKI